MINIVFDLGKVLLIGDTVKILDYIDITDEEYQELKKMFKYDVNLDLGNIDVIDVYNSLNISKELKEKYKTYLTRYYEYRKINFDLVRLINYLKNQHYNIYVISDNNISAAKYYQKNLLFKNIDGWVFSCDYHEIKKNIKLFEIFLDKYKLKAEDCYFIDDNIDNINGAKKLGFNTFNYDEEKGINPLLKDLEKKGVLISKDLFK